MGLGGNLQDPSQRILEAMKILASEFLEDMRPSSLFETLPWGVENQPNFLNAAVIGYSEWKPPAVVNYLKTLERRLGRTERVRFGPREIDLDLLLYGEGVWKSDGVDVPHPRMSERSFVLVPLLELIPQWLHPVDQKTIGELCKEKRISLETLPVRISQNEVAERLRP